MAFDIYTYFNSLGPTVGGMPANMAASTAQSLLNQLQNGDPAAADQLREMFGQDVFNTITNPSSLGGGSTTTAPTPTTNIPQINTSTPTPSDPSTMSTAITPPTLTSAPTSGTATDPNVISNPFGAVQPIPTLNPGGGYVPTYGPSTIFGDANRDMSAIEQEAATQRALSLGTLDQQRTGNQQYLQDLSGLLQQQQAQQLNEQLPGVYEDLNTRGLLRSSALGNSLATNATNLARETSLALGQQGLQFQNQYNQGLGGIQTAYEGMRNQALNRGLTLEDYNNQVRAGQLLGFNVQPQTPNTGKSDTANTLTAGASLAGTAAKLGSK